MLHQIARFTAVVPLIEELGGGGLLDVGSGSEGVAGWLGPEWEVTALDRSFETPGAMAGPRGAARRTTVGDARRLPFEDRAFDVVLALDVLEHIDPADREQALRELARTARRRLIVACPTGDAALAADMRLAAALRRRGMALPSWLAEHEANGFPHPEQLREVLSASGRVRAIGDENLRWHEWLFRLESRRPGYLLSRATARALARGLAARGPLAAVSRAAVRVVRGPARCPCYRTIAVLDVG